MVQHKSTKHLDLFLRFLKNLQVTIQPIQTTLTNYHNFLNPFLSIFISIINTTHKSN